MVWHKLGNRGQATLKLMTHNNVPGALTDYLMAGEAESVDVVVDVASPRRVLNSRQTPMTCPLH